MVGDKKKMDTRLIGPIALFVIGIVVMFISGGDKMFLAGGAVLVALAGIGLMMINNKPSSVIPKTNSGR
jgi:hypothetical protein